MASRPCNPKFNDISIHDYLLELENMMGGTGVHKCLYCNQVFNNPVNKCRHQKTCPQQNINTNSQTTSAEIDLLRKEIQDLKEMFINNHTTTTPAATNPPNVNINGDNNTINNNINNINNNVNNNVTIVLNNFGNETYEHIDDEFLKNCIMNSVTGAKNLIEKIHFSDEALQNKNIRLKSAKKKLVEVAQDQRWVIRDANDATDSMIKRGCVLMQKAYGNPDTGIMEIDINELDARIQIFLSSIMDNKSNQYYDLRRRIFALILDNAA